MVTAKEFPNRKFSSKGELFEALRQHKSDLIAQKCMATKFSDPIALHPTFFDNKERVIKSENLEVESINSIKAELAINTTNFMDSHNDVHFPGLWSKSLKEKKGLYLLQEHAMKFDSIITDDVKAMARFMEWKDLGAPYQGKTQVLLFKVNIPKERNPFMFDQYAKGYVKNHSVGMRYVKISLAMNSESEWDKEEKEVWDKYFDEIANREAAEVLGYFWAVNEAKAIEGSAVPIGSNTITPTISMEGKEAGSTTSSKGAAQSTPNVAEYYKNLL